MPAGTPVQRFSSLGDVLELVRRPWAELGVRELPKDVQDLFLDLKAIAAAEAEPIAGEAELQGFRARWAGRRSGILTLVDENWLAQAPREMKRAIGLERTPLQRHIEELLAAAERRLRAAESAERGQRERVDVTLPGRSQRLGTTHPLVQVTARILDIFTRIGYSVVEGPEIETAYYNFEALNVPESHPARDDQDTLYLGPGLKDVLLRTHTSPMQIRTMQKQPPPIRVVVPGKVYRRDTPDATHSPMFQQVEGLAVDADITLGDLKGTLDHFAREFFGAATRTRFRPSYFPFTEPSAEMDVSCIFCSGAGCRTCKQSGWIEVLGCGMVDPALFGYVNYDPGRWSGFAFGMGVERLAMLLYGVEDIQAFFDGEIRVLEQFRR